MAAHTNLVRAYLDARDRVIAEGHGSIIDFYRTIPPVDELDEERFLSNAAWCILAAGMSERVLRGLFPLFSEAFLGFRLYPRALFPLANHDIRLPSTVPTTGTPSPTNHHDSHPSPQSLSIATTR